MAKESKNPKGQNEISLRNSIKTRLIADMLLVVAVPLLVSLIISYITSTKKAQSDAETALAWQAKYLAASYEDIIDKNLMVLRSVADNPTTIVYMQGIAGIEDDVMIKMFNCRRQYP